MVEAQPPAPLVRLLMLAGAALDARMLPVQRAAGFTGLRPAHSAVFAHVPPEGIHLSELARRAGMTKQAIGELVADLETLGYLRKRPDLADRRRTRIEFTDRGKASVRLALATFDEQEQELAQLLGDRRLRQLRDDLARITEHFGPESEGRIP